MHNVVETRIDAPPAEVFRHVCDFARYPAWNPFTPEVVGTCGAGELVEVTVKLDGDPFRMKRRIVELVPGERFAWEGAAWYSRLVPGLRAITCVDDGAGGTRLVDDERLGGLVFLMPAKLKAAVRSQMVAFGAALKAEVERSSAAAGA